MTYPTAAVDYLGAWTTANFGNLSRDAIILEFSEVAQNYSLIVDYALGEVAEAQGIAVLVTEAEGHRDDAADDAGAADTARQAAQAAQGLAETAQAAAQAAQAGAEAHEATAATLVGGLDPVALEFLYAPGVSPWQLS